MDALAMPGRAAVCAEQPPHAREIPRVVWAGAAVVALGVVLATPFWEKYPAALLGIGAYFALPLLRRGSLPLLDEPLCPYNWAMVHFALLLVVMPTAVAWVGPVRGTLPFLPSDRYINLAIGAQTVAFAGFCLGTWLWRPRRRPARAAVGLAAAEPPAGRIAVAYAVLGVLGLALTFGSLGALVTYFANPALALLARDDGPATLRSAAGTFLRPFLIFAPVVAWSQWADRRGAVAGFGERAGLLLLTALVVLFGGATFNYNRAAFVMPLVTLLGTYSRSVRRISVGVLGAVAAALVAASLVVGTYRSSGLALQQAVNDPVAQAALQQGTDASTMLQVYGGAPQFLGFLLEANDFSEHHYLGTTLVSSAFFPIPIVGKAFRSSAGVTLYNLMVYGDSSIADQILPFQGELYLNFHVVGVIVGFALLGAAIAALQRRFVTERAAFVRYACLYASVWLSFLSVGSLAAVSQIFIYFGWPFYLYLAARWLVRRPAPVGRR